MAFRIQAPWRIACPISLVLAIIILGCGSLRPSDPAALINEGRFEPAASAINTLLASDTMLTPRQRLHWQFELERMHRIRLDFTKSRDEVLPYIRRWIPEATDQDLRAWEESKALEVMTIDGQQKYFNSAARNLFRVDREARAIWRAKHASEPPPKGLENDSIMDCHLREIMADAERLHTPFVKPVRLHIRHAIDIPPGIVPAGETIRCWIPFPREIAGRQGDIKVLSTIPAEHLIAGSHRLQRTVYFETEASAKDTTHFEITYEYTSHGVYLPLTADSVIPAPVDEALAAFMKEEPPHIVFTPQLRDLSKRVLGEVTNPYLKAQRLFAWADTNITWATAREYSTVPNLSMYAYENKHGDCGMQTMLFITLCRMNGIPARWQSGWEFQPPASSMHDWGMVYFAPYGWVPMDVTYGVRETKDKSLKWFYLSGMDSYRLIFNDEASVPFYPAKVFPRSETVDSQRGEVEWRGGNLYFDQWDWSLEWKIL
jgi:hypothetical protein